MKLTKEEEELVLNYREKRKEAKALRDKQASCKHEWSYRGEWRGESSYECWKCGETKWE